ncbi:MAG: hypothetical protein M3081_19750, partial [Gemmatimonadota bacterium]|nr:hypothetical protein [Gemmatimonadota bacterium]
MFPTARIVRVGTIAGLIAAFGMAAQAQDTTATRPATVIPDTLVGACAGEIISDIEFQTGRPPFGGISAVWRAAARMVGMHHQTTRTSVVAAFLQLRVGQPCTDRARLESERVLRAQPFLATARVRAIPDVASPGHVLVIVQTTDEIPVIVGARISRNTLSRFSFGNSNLGGLGVAAQGELERGFAYRTGFGARIDDYAFAFMPVRATIGGERDPLGSSWELGLSHPFFTDLQSTSWRGSVYGLHE